LFSQLSAKTKNGVKTIVSQE